LTDGQSSDQTPQASNSFAGLGLGSTVSPLPVRTSPWQNSHQINTAWELTMRLAAAFACTGMLICSGVSPAALAEDFPADRAAVVQECDRLAASPYDASRPAEIAGVDHDKLDAAQAVPACRAAIAALTDYPRVAFELGRALQKAGGAEAEAEAARWYRHAADAGNALAMNNLGVMYETGRGVEMNPAEAVRWYRKAADAGLAVGADNLGHMYEYGTGVTEDKLEAVRLYRRAARAGLTDGMYKLGKMYESGKGVVKDEAEAVLWYRRAADAGSAYGMANLGSMYENGRGVAKDDAEAVNWYRRAAEAGNAAGMVDLGAMYENGTGVPQDYTEARSWYEKALAAGYEPARSALAALNAHTGTRD
jgi:TPR repeat protein